MNLKQYITRRAIYLIITLFAIILFNFFLFRIMPGDPAKVLVPKTNDLNLIHAIRMKFHLDQPLLTQFYYYLIQVFTGDLGISSGVWKYQPINRGIVAPAINTVVLVGLGTVVAVWAGVTLGRFAAWRRGKPADTMGMAFALTFYSMPTFLFALVILMIFGGQLKWFPLSHSFGELPFVSNPPSYADMNILQKIVSRLYHLVLPLTAFTIEMLAEYALILRNSLTDVLTEDYIVTARAKGLSSKQILHEHAMPNAMLPVVTVVAISVGWVLGGDIMVELVFSYDGLGLLTWEAVLKRDYCVLQALFLLMAIAVLISNLVADIIYMYLDPRVQV